MVPMVYQYRSRFYQWYIGKTISANGNDNGTIGSPNGTIGTIVKPMVPLINQWYHWLPLVKLPMVPLGNPGQSLLTVTVVYVRWFFLRPP